MARLYFITHPDVAIDPAMPVPDWPLNERGRARMSALLTRPWVRDICAVFTSSERKARDSAEILADGLGLDGYQMVEDLGENDRSSTGFLPRDEFEAIVDAFFAQPQTKYTRVGTRGRRAKAHHPRSRAYLVYRTGWRRFGDHRTWRHWYVAVLLSCAIADQPTIRSATDKWRKLVCLRPR